MSASNRKRQAAAITPNRGSAGRANGGKTGVRQRQMVVRLAEFSRHCDKFMVEHVPGWVCRDFGGRDSTEEIRKMVW